VAYNASSRKRFLTSCVAGYPEYGDWLGKIMERVKDLLAPSRTFDVYYPCQHGTAFHEGGLPALTGKDLRELGNP